MVSPGYLGPCAFKKGKDPDQQEAAGLPLSRWALQQPVRDHVSLLTHEEASPSLPCTWSASLALAVPCCCYYFRNEMHLTGLLPLL